MANNWSAGHFSTGCKDERRREGVGSEERTEMICLARPSRWMKIEGTKKLGAGGWESLGYVLKNVDFNVKRKHSLIFDAERYHNYICLLKRVCS